MAKIPQRFNWLEAFNKYRGKQVKGKPMIRQVYPQTKSEPLIRKAGPMDWKARKTQQRI